MGSFAEWKKRREKTNQTVGSFAEWKKRRYPEEYASEPSESVAEDPFADYKAYDREKGQAKISLLQDYANRANEIKTAIKDLGADASNASNAKRISYNIALQNLAKEYNTKTGKTKSSGSSILSDEGKAAVAAQNKGTLLDLGSATINTPEEEVDFDKLLREAQEYHNKATKYQDDSKLYESIVNDPEYAAFVEKVKNAQTDHPAQTFKGSLEHWWDVLTKETDRIKYADYWGGYLTPDNMTLYVAGDEMIILPKLMNDQEKTIYYWYFYQLEDTAKAEEYYQSIKSELENRAYQLANENVYQQSKEKPGFTSVQSVLRNVYGTPAEAIVNTGKYIIDDFSSKEPVEFDRNRTAENVQIARSGVSEDMSPVGRFLYNTAMSGADSLLSGLSFGKAGGVALALSAGASTYNEALDKGMNADDALAYGLAAGVFEGVFESISLGRLLKKVPVDTWADVVKNLAISMGVNASEEMATEVANLTYDSIANGEFSQWAELKEQGYSWYDIIGKFGLQTLEAGASGALMGFGFGGIQSGASAVNVVNDTINTGKRAKAKGLTDTLVKTGLGYEGTSAYKAAQKVQKNATNYRVGRLAQTLSKSTLQKTFNDTVGDSKIASALTDIVSGREVSKSAISEILGNEKALKALNDTLGTSINSGVDVKTFRETVANAVERQTDSAIQSLNEDLRESVSELIKGNIISDSDINAVINNKDARELLNWRTGADISKNSTVQDVKQVVAEANNNNTRASLAVVLAASLDMGANGTRGIAKMVANSSVDVARAVQAFNAVYQMGKQGKAISEARNPYLSELTMAQRLAAYEYGVMDGLTSKTETKVDKEVDNAVDEEVTESAEEVAEEPIVTKGGETIALVKENTKEQTRIIDMGKKLGVEVAFGKISKNGKNIDGLFDGKVLYINPNTTSGNAAYILFKHEFTHFLEKSTKYIDFAKEVTESKAFSEWLKKKGFKNSTEYYAQIIADYKQIGKNLEEGGAQKEAVANFCAEMLYAKDDSMQRFVDTLSVDQKRTFGELIRDFIDWIKKKLGKVDEIAMLEKKYAEVFKATKGLDADTADAGKTALLYVGKNAKTADLIKLETAQRMIADGVDSETVRKEIGWFKGYDGEWRFEIDDSNMQIIKEHLLLKEGKYTLDEVISHANLFEAYPELAKMEVVVQRGGFVKGAVGAYIADQDILALNSAIYLRDEDVKKVIAHEIQHKIQRIEGFTRGSSPEYWEKRGISEEEYINFVSKTEKALAKEKKNLSESDLAKLEEYYALGRRQDALYSKLDFKNIFDEEKNAEMQKILDQITPIEKRHDELYDYLYYQPWFSRINDLYYQTEMGDKLNTVFYKNTAGEIEARNAAERINLSTEERKNTRPDIDRPDVVFADKSSVSYFAANKENYSKVLKNNNESDIISTEYSYEEGYHATDEFRKLQEESRGMSTEEIQMYHSGDKEVDAGVRANIARILQSQIESHRNGLRNDYGLLSLTAKGSHFDIYEGVNPSLFHDCFEIAQKYLRNGELVTLHDVKTTTYDIGYEDCYNYLSKDGLSGFAITPKGDLISVFNASGKAGFLNSIAPIVKERAMTLDCYNSPLQPLMAIYSKVLGFKPAAIMDHNMEFDHDNIAVNHNYPKVAFMVNTDAYVKTKEFNKDQYEQAQAYQQSFVKNNDTQASYTPDKEATSTREILANMMDTVAESEREKNLLAKYKGYLERIDNNKAEIARLKEERKAASKAKKNVFTTKIKALEKDISDTERRLSNLEAMDTIKRLVAKERAKLADEAQLAGQMAQGRRDAEKIRRAKEDAAHLRESRNKATEGRHKTQVKKDIANTMNELYSMLKTNTESKHIHIDLQEVVKEALEAIDINAPKEDNYAKKLADIDRQIAELSARGNTGVEYSELINKRAKIQENKDNFRKKLEKIQAVYERIEKAEKIPSYYKEEAKLIQTVVKQTMDDIGETRYEDMNLEQLKSVYKMYRIILQTVRDVNKVIRDGKREDLIAEATNLETDLSEIKKLSEERPAVADALRNFAWGELTPYYAFARIGSKTLMKYYWDLIKAQNTYARDVKEFEDFANTTRKKYGFKNWDLDATYSLKDKDGHAFKLSLKHLMSIYAYSKREQALDHMSKGGLFFNDKETFRKEGKLLKFIRSNENGYRIGEGTIADIIVMLNEIDENIIDYIDEMQDYLTKMGDKGNEVTREMWGINVFNEEIYFPLKSKDDFIYQANTPAETSSLKNSGMTKATKPHASNPIVIEGFDEVWVNHCEKMSKYHAFVIPIDNLNKLINFGSWSEDRSSSISTMITARFTSAANNYLTTFIKDLNGAKAQSHPAMVFANNLVSKFKKTAVAASLSVIVQQPTAILRATAVIDPKYFVGLPKATTISNRWDTIKKHAPIAIIKDIGGFDAGSGRTATELVNRATKRGIDKLAADIDDITMYGAALGDRIGWGSIWIACEREIAATTKLEVGSEEYFEAVGERFTEIIVKTQVYDSTLSRSGFMREKDSVMKMATSFMGEPTLSFNMMADALLQAKRGAITKSRMVRTMAAVTASIMAANIAKSFIYALRDDDEDESYLEKYLQAFGRTMSFWGELNPLTMVPFVRDIVSIFEGWDVERSDMALITDVKSAIDSLSNENKSVYRKLEDFLGAIGALAGIPAKNLLRTGREMYSVFENIFDGIEGGDLGAAITGEKKSKSEKLHDAIMDKDKARIEVYRKDYKTDSSYESALKSALRTNEPRVQSAVEASLNGNYNLYNSTKRTINAQSSYGLKLINDAFADERDYVLEKLKEARAAKKARNYAEYNRIVDMLVERGYTRSFINKKLK